MKNLILAITFVFFLSIFASGQCPVMPDGFVCLSQAAANVARDNAFELAATKAKVVILEAALVEKDKIIADNKAVADKNQADLKEALHKTEVELAAKTGQLIGSEASNTRNLAVIDVLLKNSKKKCGFISILCL